MAWASLVKINQENLIQEQPQLSMTEKSSTLNQKNMLTISTNWKSPKPEIYIPTKYAIPSHRLYNRLLNQSHFSQDQMKVLQSLYKKLILPYCLKHKNYISFEKFLNFCKNYNDITNYKKIKVSYTGPNTDNLPYLSRQQEKALEEYKTPEDKAENLIKMLELDKVEEDPLNYHINFELEAKVRELCIYIKDICYEYELFTFLNSSQLLAFLHPDYVPLF
jgi:hypothetical protein